MTPELEDLLMTITNDVDNSIAEMCNRHNIPPMAYSSIVLARLMRMNMELGTGKEFVQLIRDCSIDAELTMMNDNGNVH